MCHTLHGQAFKSPPRHHLQPLHAAIPQFRKISSRFGEGGEQIHRRPVHRRYLISASSLIAKLASIRRTPRTPTASSTSNALGRSYTRQSSVSNNSCNFQDLIIIGLHQQSPRNTTAVKPGSPHTTRTPRISCPPCLVKAYPKATSFLISSLFLWPEGSLIQKTSKHHSEASSATQDSSSHE